MQLRHSSNAWGHIESQDLEDLRSIRLSCGFDASVLWRRSYSMGNAHSNIGDDQYSFAKYPNDKAEIFSNFS